MAMKKSILVEIKQVYGEEKIYPVCLDSQTFAKIAGTKTLTRSTIAYIKEMGYTVEVQTQVISL